MTETTVRQNCGMKMYLTCLHNVAKLAFRLNGTAQKNQGNIFQSEYSI